VRRRVIVASMPDRPARPGSAWRFFRCRVRPLSRPLQALTRQDQHQTQRGSSNIVQHAIALWGLVTTGEAPEGLVLRPAG
jgi:hypothetical protein